MMSRLPSGSVLCSVLFLFACTSSRESEREATAQPPPVAAPLPPFPSTVYEAAATIAIPEVEPREHPELHNVFALSDQIVSGSEPHGEEAFQILHEMGIRTILSVDGKVPDSEMAAKYGMKYVHVPIQYKGISSDELTRIAKTFREQEGPFFVHCFHGKHRGPAAAEIGRLVVDGISRETALAEMRRCGTAETYEGLYTTVAYAGIPSPSETEALQWDFPAASPLDGLAAAMVLVSRADDNLKAFSKRRWEADAAHPDVDPLNEATKLASLFERSLSLADVKARPAEFQQWMADSRSQSVLLRQAVEALRKGSGSPEEADKAYKTLAKTCTACHDVYRNRD